MRTGNYQQKTQRTTRSAGLTCNSIAQELPGLPPFRQQAGYTAYVEGWALFANYSAEMGFIRTLQQLRKAGHVWARVPAGCGYGHPL